MFGNVFFLGELCPDSRVRVLVVFGVHALAVLVLWILSGAALQQYMEKKSEQSKQFVEVRSVVGILFREAWQAALIRPRFYSAQFGKCSEQPGRERRGRSKQ